MFMLLLKKSILKMFENLSLKMSKNNEMQYVSFGLASREDILKYSTVEVNSTERKGPGSVYDTRMGPCARDDCCVCKKSCLDCCGHFGHINLARPIVNPMFINNVLHLVNNFCINCCTPLPKTSSALKKNKSIPIVKKCVSCGHQCKAMVSDTFTIKYGSKNEHVNVEQIYDFLSRMDIKHLKKLKYKPSLTHPKNMILHILPILPHVCRPYVAQSAQVCDDDLTTLYIEVVKLNRKILQSTCEKQTELLVNQQAYVISTLFNNTHGAAKHPSSGRHIRGIIERLCGKDGLFRNNCMGKRSDFTARAVAAPGPELEMDQVGIPKSITEILTKPILCTWSNIIDLQDMCDRDMVPRVTRNNFDFNVARFRVCKQTKLQRGDVLFRNGKRIETTGHEILRETDSLFRKNMYINFVTEKKRSFTLKIDDTVHVKLQNDDWVVVNRQPTLSTGSMIGMRVKVIDGYCIRMPLSTTNRLNLDFDGDEINIHAIQSVEGTREVEEKMSAKNTMISPSSGKLAASVVQDTVLAWYLISNDKFSIRLRLPIQSEFVYGGVVIRDGELTNGVFTKHILSQLVLSVYKKEGRDVAANLVTFLQHVGVSYLSKRGFTISLIDLLPMDDLWIRQQIEENISVSNTKTLRDTIHEKIIERDEQSNLWKCIASGTKGTIINIGQLRGLLGQQQVTGENLPALLTFSRVLAQDRPIYNCEQRELTPYEYIKKHGFIDRAFAHGLSLAQFFLHCIPSRNAIVSVATGTGVSGYLQHRLNKCVDDVMWENNMLVYSSSNRTVLGYVYKDPRDKYE